MNVITWQINQFKQKQQQPQQSQYPQRVQQLQFPEQSQIPQQYVENVSPDNLLSMSKYQQDIETAVGMKHKNSLIMLAAVATEVRSNIQGMGVKIKQKQNVVNYWVSKFLAASAEPIVIIPDVTSELVRWGRKRRIENLEVLLAIKKFES
ncbi:6561_t:CDS:2 [Diversispora eburnea]|uniref:6561_t:CDS:1 n=1 Tax=Diversispora eburnea TaxID=1213867 RepID=A0A9N9BTF8_9GLOM|nr:6561_t:CDS:2 [Diversispora eburnea]